MDMNKKTYKSLVERLDRTAETNPLLWLPCVTLLGAVIGTRRLVNDIRTVLSPVKDAEPDVSGHVITSDKPAYVRALSAFLAAAMMITFAPGLNGISAFAEENSIETEAEDQDNEDSENTADQEAAQETGSDDTASKPKSKRDIKITLNCMLRGMTAGNAHASINKSYLDNSADVWLISSDAARKDAEDVMIQLGSNAAYYVCYPFEINVYDADSKEPVTLAEGGAAYIEMPIPKIMSSCADKIKVYHVDESHPDFVESEIAVSEEGNQSIQFNASKFSTYIFVAPSPAKDSSSVVQDNTPAADKDSDKDVPTADAGDDGNISKDSIAPVASDDTSSADSGEEGSVPSADNDDAYYDDGSGVVEDVSSAAGAHEASVPMETAAMPVSGGTSAALGEAPERLRLSTKKRRYRIVSKRRLDDMVFVL